MLDLWQRYAPNLRDAVIDTFVRSPLDVERSLPNMRGGDLLVGAFTGDQIGYHRPFPGAGGYRTHIPNLYLCGSSSHPGGNITGLPGYNAAQVILRDLGIEAEWMPPPIASGLPRCDTDATAHLQRGPVLASRKRLYTRTPSSRLSRPLCTRAGTNVLSTAIVMTTSSSAPKSAAVNGN